MPHPVINKLTSFGLDLFINMFDHSNIGWNVQSTCNYIPLPSSLVSRIFTIILRSHHFNKTHFVPGFDRIVPKTWQQVSRKFLLCLRAVRQKCWRHFFGAHFVMTSSILRWSGQSSKIIDWRSRSRRRCQQQHWKLEFYQLICNKKSQTVWGWYKK